MPFTNVWDVTTPPDTQPANQLGLDLRNLKTDVMQRMSALSGLAANIPAPETINANWTGLIYIATDTKQLFQWSGAAWVDISSALSGSGLLNAQPNAAPLVGSGAAKVIYTFNLPAATIALLQGLRISFSLEHSNGVAQVAYTFSLNGVGFAFLNTTNAFNGIINVLNTGPAAGSWSYVGDRTGMTGAAENSVIAGLNWAGVQVLTVSFNNAATESVRPVLWLVEKVS